MDVTFFTVVAIIAIAIQTFLLFLALFEPMLRYRISGPRPVEPDAESYGLHEWLGWILERQQ